MQCQPLDGDLSYMMPPMNLGSQTASQTTVTEVAPPTSLPVMNNTSTLSTTSQAGQPVSDDVSFDTLLEQELQPANFGVSHAQSSIFIRGAESWKKSTWPTEINPFARKVSIIISNPLTTQIQMNMEIFVDSKDAILQAILKKKDESIRSSVPKVITVGNNYTGEASNQNASKSFRKRSRNA